MTKQDLLKQIKKTYSDILNDNLVGIYVHGSIAFGCFHWEQSDIDFLVVVRRVPSLQEKIQLISALLTLEPYAPPKGFKMSVIREEFCRHFSYPTPYELHFSNAYREICRVNPTAFCAGMHGTDKDLAAHITVVRAVGQTLCGKPINDVFDEVPKAYYLDSISCDIENAVQDVADHPVYIILNLCRVLAFVREGSVPFQGTRRHVGDRTSSSGLPFPHYRRKGLLLQKSIIHSRPGNQALFCRIYAC